MRDVFFSLVFQLSTYVNTSRLLFEIDQRKREYSLFLVIVFIVHEEYNKKQKNLNRLLLNKFRSFL